MTAVGVRDGWSAVGWSHPSPGDPGAVRALMARYQQRSADLRAVDFELTQGLHELDGWHGVAAQQLQGQRQRLRLGLERFAMRFERCVEALDRYASGMDGRRHQADVLLPRVLDVKRRLAVCQKSILTGSPEAIARAVVAQPGLLAEEAGLIKEWALIRGAHEVAVALCCQHLMDVDGNVLQDAYTRTAVWATTSFPGVFRASDAATRWFVEHSNGLKEVADAIDDLAFAIDSSQYSGFFPVAALSVGLSFLANIVRSVAWQYGADVDESEITWADIKNAIGVLDLYAKNLGAAGHVADYLAKRLHKLDVFEHLLEPLGADPVHESLPQYWSPRADVGSGLTGAFWKAVSEPRMLVGSVAAR